MKLMRQALIPVVAAGIISVVCSCGPGACAGRESACVDIEQRYDAVLVAAPGACRGAAGCGCYVSISKKTCCCGVTDAGTAARLAEIEKEYYRACGRPRRAICPCAPACVKGRCERARYTE